MSKTCAGTNKDGSSCSNRVAGGKKYCHIHRSSSSSKPSSREETKTGLGEGIFQGSGEKAEEKPFWKMMSEALLIILSAHFLVQFLLWIG